MVDSLAAPTKYSEGGGPAAIDPYTDAAYVAPPAAPADPPPPTDPPRARSRSHSPPRYRSPGARSSGGYRRRSPPPRRPNHAPIVAPNPSPVLGVFGLSIRTHERDLEDEFSRFGRVEKVTIVYDQRSDRSRGFGFITMASVEEAARCIQELNGVDLNGRRIRVDYSVTDRPHAPTPGEYMGLRRSGYDSHRDSHYRSSYRGHHDRGHHDRDPYGRDSRDWRDRRSPPPARGGGGRYSPRRRSYSRSPPRGGSPPHSRRDYDDDRAGPRW